MLGPARDDEDIPRRQFDRGLCTGRVAQRDVEPSADEQASAVGALAEALTLACPQGYVRVFADEGAPMGALLARLVTAQRDEQTAARSVELGFLARLLRAFSSKDAVQGSARGAATAVPGLLDPLTARELEVLRLLAAGTTNQDIAGELVVSLDTVKKHVSHVLGKLGAANRTEAVARARQLGLIRQHCTPRPTRMAPSCQRAGRGSFPPPMHLRVMPTTAAARNVGRRARPPSAWLRISRNPHGNEPRR